jgi:acyl-CoA oxidase
VRSVLDEVFADPLFERPDGLSPAQRHRLTYQRIRLINERFPLDRGLPGDPDRLWPLLERAAVADPALFHVLSLHLCVGVASLVEFGGGDDTCAEYLADLEKLSSFATILVTESGYGASHVAVRTEARYDPGDRSFVLHTPDATAAKSPSHVAAAGEAKLGIVIARLRAGDRDCGVFPFAVPIRDETGPLPGIRVTPLPDIPLLPVDFATVVFDQVRLPFGAWLPDGATLDADGTFTDPCATPDARLVRTLGVVPNMQAAATVALAAVTKAAVTEAIHYACTRTSMARLSPGLPIIRYRSVQQPLFDALATTLVIDRLTESVRHTASAQPGGATVGWSPWTAANRQRALVKVWTVTAAEQVTDTCRRYSGAQGFITSRFLEYQGLAHAFQTAAGDNRTIMLDAAQAMIDYRGYLPPVAELTDPDTRSVLDPELWQHLARSRESMLHRRLGERLATAGPACDEFSRWNDQLPLALDLAGAHLDRTVLDCVLTGGPSTSRGPVVDLLSACFAVRRLRDHAGWYLCEGLLSAEQVRSLDDTLVDLCRRIEPHAASITSALGWA